MLIYIVIKIIFEICSIYFKKNIFKYFFFLFELFIIFFYFYFNIYYLFNKYLFIWCLFWLSLFLGYKGLNYILNKVDNVLSRVEKKEKIKKFFLNPKVNKVVYYMMWSLPWNIGYWIYFWIIENGWYMRVWISSNRDIFFWKYFKWDSRHFFFNLNKIIFHNIFFLFLKYIKNDFIKFFLRALMLLSFLRKKMLEISFFEYMLNRTFVFCYLSIFYLYFFENIKIFNIWLLIFLLFLEFIFIFFIGYVLKYLVFNKNENIKYFYKLSDPLMIQIIIDPLMHKFYLPAKSFFEINNTVWNIILGNSVTLNILKKYMIWVNKNTKGYYYKEMNILPKNNIKKLYDLNSIPFDILPQTRYVIFSLYYVNCSDLKQIESDVVIFDYSILQMKNIYLSYFEKTYSANSSLLSIIFLLKINYLLNYSIINELYKDSINDTSEKIIGFILMDQKSILWRLKLAEISIFNPNLLNTFFILNSFSDKQVYDIEYYFMYNFFCEDLKDKIPNISFDNSLKNYKENIKFLSNFLFYQEEGIVWNKDIVKFLHKFDMNLCNNRTYYNKIFFDLLNKSKKTGSYVNTQVNTVETFIEELDMYFKFDKKIDYNKLFNSSLEYYKLIDIKIIEIKVNKELSLNEQIDILFEDLENVDSNDLKSSRFYFLFENEN